nr:SufE family protein [Amylibacter sp.]
MMTEEFQEIVETFEFLDDWEDRYRHVIELGKEMPPLDEALRVDATKVDGCASQVWIVPKIEGQGPDAIFRFQGESDAMIVRGLIAILLALFNNTRLQDVVDTDAAAAFAQLGLDQHLSAQRSNGLRAMIVRIQSLAQQNIASDS